QLPRNETSKFRRDLSFGQVDEVRAKAISDCLIKVGLVDKATIDHRLRYRLPVQLYFAHDILRLRRLQHTLLDKKFCKLFMRHRFTPSGSARVSRAGFGVAPKQSFVSVP